MDVIDLDYGPLNLYRYRDECSTASLAIVGDTVLKDLGSAGRQSGFAVIRLECAAHMPFPGRAGVSRVDRRRSLVDNRDGVGVRP